MDDLRLAQLLNKNISDNKKLQILKNLDVTYTISNESSAFQVKDDFLGYNCLHVAAIKFDLDLTQKLINLGAIVLQQGIHDGKTPLHKAVDHISKFLKTSVWQCMGVVKEDSLVNVLLYAQIKSHNPFNAKCKNGISHLHIACMYNHAEAVWFFAKVNEPLDQAISFDSNIFPGYTPLHCAIRYSSSEAAVALLTLNADIYVENAVGMSSICYLIDRLLDVNSYLKKLDGSHSYHNEEEMERLSSILKAIVLKNRKNDSELIKNTGVSVFHLACTLKDTWIMKSYIGQGFKDINKSVTKSKFWAGWTPLHFAVCCNIQAFSILLKNGADIKIKNAKGETAFDLCLQRYNIEVSLSYLSIDTLLSNERTSLSNLMVIMSKYNTRQQFWHKLKDINLSVPLEYPIWSGYNLLHISVLMTHRARLLQACHQEIDYCSKSGYLASVPSEWIDITFSWRRFESILRKCCSVYTKDANGLTPIHLAFKLDEWHALEELLARAHRDVVGQGNLSLLHIACAMGKVDVVERLLRNEADVNSRVTSSFERYGKPQTISVMSYQNESRRVLIRANSTPLHIAVLFREYGVIDKLLDKNADVHAEDELGITPLHSSFIVSDEYIAQSLLRKASSNLRDVRTKDGLSYLHVAAFADDDEAVKKLLWDGADMKDFIRDSAPECFAAFVGKTPLHLAVEGKKAARVLIKNGANILAENPYRNYATPLDLAMTELTCSAIFEKLKRKIKLGALTASGLTTLHVACSTLDLEWARKLLNRGANPNAQTKDDKGRANTAMHLVIARATSAESIPANLRSFVELLIEYGADVNISNNFETPLHLIANAYFDKRYLYYRDRESDQIQKAVLLSIGDWLLSNQRSYAINPTNADGFSHFHFACVTNNCAMIKKYLDNGVDINHAISLFAENRESFTPLHFAIMHQNINVAQMLLKRGADVRVKDTNDNTLLHFAIKHYINFQLLDWLLGKGVDINAKNVKGQTPILCLLSRRNVTHDQKIAVAQILLKRGADVSIEDTDGDTPLHLSIKHLNNFQLFDTLLRKGADINAKNVRGQTPILCLLSRGNVTYDQFRFFVNRGSRIDITDTINNQGIMGYTMERTKPSDLESVVENLMELINLNDAIKKGFLAIHSLVSVYSKEKLIREHYLSIIQILTAKGSDIDEVDEEGERALDVAISFRNKAAINALLFLGANVNVIEDKDGHSSIVEKPLHLAYQRETPIYFMDDHLSKMALIKLDLSTSVQRAMKNRRWESDEGEMQIYLSELKKIEDTNICNSLNAKHFLSEWGAVIEYPSMPVAKRQVVDNFFKKGDNLRKEFPEFAGLLMMQYRKALARVKLMQPVKDILVAAGIDLPDLCLEAILEYLKNSELNFLIENADEISQPVKRRRFQ